MFGSKKTTVINTTTVDNNIYLDNDIQNDVSVVAEFNPTFANAVTVDTQPIADAVAKAVAPMDRMGEAIKSSMDANAELSAQLGALQFIATQQSAGALAAVGAGLSAQGAGLSAQGEGLAAVGAQLSAQGEGLAGIAGKVESVSKIAAGLLTIAALYFLLSKGRLPDIEVSA